MQPGMNSYHFEPHFEPRQHFSPFTGAPVAPHAAQFHAPSTPHIGDTMFKHYDQQAHAGLIHNVPAAAPAHSQPQNSYASDATVTNITDHRVLRGSDKLKIGDVVEVNRHGHSELAYVNGNNQLRPLDEAAIHHVPPELRSHIIKIGGPAYFAHEIHNRIATQGLAGQFKPSDNHGPNKPLI